MTAMDRFERILPAALTELANPQTPDYLADVLHQTADTRQRHAWASLERWLPLDIATTRAPATRLPLRAVGVLALMALLIAAILVAYVGSRPRLPAPFGLAANGLLAISRDGDIYTIDPDSGEEGLLVGGPTYDDGPSFSRDGTQILFLRASSQSVIEAEGRLAIASLADGTVVELTAEPLTDLSAAEFSPDGTTLAVRSRIGGRLQISLLSTDGTSQRNFGDVRAATTGNIAFLAPDGRELVFVAPFDLGARSLGLAALDLTTGTTRVIVPGSSTRPVWGNMSASPSGTDIAYGVHDLETGVITTRLVATDGSNDRVVGHADGATFEAWPQWSPSGRYLLLERRVSDLTMVVRPVVIDMQTRREVLIDTTISRNGAGKEWAPDESLILAQRTAADGSQLPQELWDIRTGLVTKASWDTISGPAWQRTAP